MWLTSKPVRNDVHARKRSRRDGRETGRGPASRFHPKSPALRRGHELSVLGEPTNQQTNLSYPPISLRRNIPAIPTSPVPSSPKVPGSGTLTFVVPVWMCPTPWLNCLLLRT